MNETIFSDEERKALLLIFETCLKNYKVKKRGLKKFERSLYLKLGEELLEFKEE